MVDGVEDRWMAACHIYREALGSTLKFNLNWEWCFYFIFFLFVASGTH